jgi:acetyltransferase
MSELRLALRLPDGTPVVARPLSPADRDHVAEAYRRLSPESRYHRFWTQTGEVIGERMLERLLQADQVNHAIWALLDPDRAFAAFAAASYWRSPDDPAEAEFTVTVLDADHRRGAATTLLAILWLNAYAHGIERFVGYVMPENRKAIRWMTATGATGAWDGYKVTFHWNLGDPRALPLTTAGGHLASQLAELAPRFLGG